ncbi:MAG: class I SAM-dependent methyltransferase [Nocardioidaceae bacterium]
MFGPRFARHLARRYGKRGLDRTASRMVDFLTQQGIDGCTVLEIGGGVGDIQLELLRRGASHATNLELSSAYDDEAMRLISESGVSNHVTRRIVDIAATPEDVEPADVVVLHRVVCCYPDFERLLTAAANHARRLLVFSHPPRNVVSRAAFMAQNLLFRLSGKSFRAFTHPPEEMSAVLERNGLEVMVRPPSLWWQVVGLERPAQTS